MPEYDYGCVRCQIVFSQIVRFKEKNEPCFCPQCNQLCYRMRMMSPNANIVSNVVSDDNFGDKRRDYISTKRRVSDNIGDNKGELVEMRKSREKQQIDLEIEIEKQGEK